MREIFIEEGIVTAVKDGITEIKIIPKDNCEECSAKIICKTSSDESHILKIKSLGIEKAGDRVKIEVPASNILFDSLKLYLIPLLILILGIFAGYELFSGIIMVELYSFIFAIGIVAVYYLLLFLNAKRTNLSADNIKFEIVDESR